MRDAGLPTWSVTVLALFHIALAAQASQERPTRDNQAVKGTSTISGRVVAAAGGTGTGEAIVSAVETISGFTKSVTADPSGAFVLENLPRGRYVLSAVKAAFIAGQYGQQTPGGTRRVLTLADDKVASGIQITLWRAGVVTGHIETATGDPLPSVQVNMMRSVVDGAITRLLPIRPTAVTSDTGEYRIHGVDPGSYFVVATPPPMMQKKGLNRTVGYRTTFYPASAIVDTAQLIAVAAESTTVANLVVQTSQLIPVSGVLADASGVATDGIRIHARSNGEAVQPQAVVFDGRFSFPLLPEGVYTFSSDVIKEAGARSVVFVADAHIDGQGPATVSLSARRAAAITGTVRLPKDVKQLAVSMQLSAVPQFDTRGGSLSAATVNKDNSFTLMAWPGPNRIQAQVGNTDLYVKAMWLGGVDVADEVVTVGNGASLEGMEVELTHVTQILSGTVTSKSDGSEPLEDLSVVAFPVDRTLRHSIRRTVLARVGRGGEFIVRSLPPGSYAVAVVSFTSFDKLRDAKFLESLESVAKTVSLSEGGQATVALRH